MSRPTRRAVLAAACGSCVTALTGCAVYGSGRPAPAGAPVAAAPAAATVPEPVAGAAAAPVETTEPTAAEPAGPPEPTAPREPPADAPPAGALAATSEVPVGGGVIVGDVVITQPAAGEFRAFSSTCTHQGCSVTSVSAGEIVCACHDSTFALADGAPTGGPAEDPLPEQAITVRDGAILRA